MVGELVMLPVRVGVRVTGLWFRALGETVSVSVTATERVIDLLSSRSAGSAGVGTTPRPPTSTTAPGSPRSVPAEPGEEEKDRYGERAGTDAAGAPESSRPPTEVRDFAPPVAPPPTPGPSLPAEPAHVSEEPELVEEFAEPGAEQGAGAEVHVEPPWDGYERMNAEQVVSRLASATPVELAAVELYEGSHRRRQTILNAVDRELRHPNGSGSQNQERGSSDG